MGQCELKGQEKKRAAFILILNLLGFLSGVNWWVIEQPSVCLTIVYVVHVLLMYALIKPTHSDCWLQLEGLVVNSSSLLKCHALFSV